MTPANILWLIRAAQQMPCLTLHLGKCFSNVSVVRITHAALDTFHEKVAVLEETQSCSWGVSLHLTSERIPSVNPIAMLLTELDISPYLQLLCYLQWPQDRWFLPWKIKLSTLHWNVSSIAAGNHYHTIMLIYHLCYLFSQADCQIFDCLTPSPFGAQQK